MTPLPIETADELAKEGIKVTVLNIHNIKPLDIKSILNNVIKCNRTLFVVEEANKIEGRGKLLHMGYKVNVNSE